MVKQTAGRDKLGEFAPKFAEINDDVLFGEVWSREDKLSLRDRSLVTVVALMSQGLVDSSFKYHLCQPKTTALQRKKLQKSSLIPHSMQDGQKLGQLSIWQKRFGQKNKEQLHIHFSCDTINCSYFKS